MVYVGKYFFITGVGKDPSVLGQLLTAIESCGNPKRAEFGGRWTPEFDILIQQAESYYKVQEDVS